MFNGRSRQSEIDPRNMNQAIGLACKVETQRLHRKCAIRVRDRIGRKIVTPQGDIVTEEVGAPEE
jgi:hypothetical protein